MPSSPISPCPSCPPHTARGHGCAVYWSSVTDAEWATLEPLLPAPGSTTGRGGRPEKHCRRAIVDAILYIVRGGIAWRQQAGTGLRGLRPLGPRRSVAAHPRRAARPTAGAGRAGPGPDRGDHRRADATRRRHRAPIQPRLGWRHENERRGRRRRLCRRAQCERDQRQVNLALGITVGVHGELVLVRTGLMRGAALVIGVLFDLRDGFVDDPVTSLLRMKSTIAALVSRHTR
jgi:Putative transposase of IS4/5 family (DUF4096)